MPWHVDKDDRCPVSKPWGVTNADTNALMGCHTSRKRALRQQAALYVNIPESKKSVGSDVQAYLMRHAHTTDPTKKNPALDAAGERQANTSSQFLRQLTTADQWPRPDRIVSSDLTRAKQTADIAAKVFGITDITVMPEIREYDPDSETPQQFEARNEKAFQTILNQPGTPLIVAHKGTTAFLDRRVRSRSADEYRPDYLHDGLLHKGGVLAIAHGGIVPLFRPINTSTVGPTRLPTWTENNPTKGYTMPVSPLNAVTKAIETEVRPVQKDDEHPNGEFELILSKDNADRDDENLWADEWALPLPSRIHMDTDHAFAKGQSVPMTAGSGVPEIDEDGNLVVKGTYAGTDHGQLTRQLVNEGHIWQASVAYQLREMPDGRVVRELLNGTFTGVPCNPEAVVLTSKSNSREVAVKTDAPLTPGSHHADPGYLDRNGDQAKGGNGVPRYQIDDASHVRNALARFAQNADKANYTDAQKRSILGRIRSAARKFGVEVSKDGGEKALVIALCKAIAVAQETQTTPANTPLSDDVGARSVYDEDWDGDDTDEDDDEGDDVAQAIHDAACALGAECCKSASAITVPLIPDVSTLKALIRPVTHSYDYSMAVAGAPGSEVYTLRHGDEVICHGNLADLTNSAKAIDAEVEVVEESESEVKSEEDAETKSVEDAAFKNVEDADSKSVAVAEDEDTETEENEEVEESESEPVVVAQDDTTPETLSKSADETTAAADTKSAAAAVTPADLAARAAARLRHFQLTTALLTQESETA